MNHDSWCGGSPQCLHANHFVWCQSQFITGACICIEWLYIYIYINIYNYIYRYIIINIMNRWHSLVIRFQGHQHPPHPWPLPSPAQRLLGRLACPLSAKNMSISQRLHLTGTYWLDAHSHAAFVLRCLELKPTVLIPLYRKSYMPPYIDPFSTTPTHQKSRAAGPLRRIWSWDVPEVLDCDM